jgi:hypothetical protein
MEEFRQLWKVFAGFLTLIVCIGALYNLIIGNGIPLPTLAGMLILPHVFIFVLGGWTLF